MNVMLIIISILKRPKVSLKLLLRNGPDINIKDLMIGFILEEDGKHFGEKYNPYFFYF
jgi:hypothetical protein